MKQRPLFISLVFATIISLIYSDPIDYKRLASDSYLDFIEGERQWLTESYLSKLNGRVLFIGVQCYNNEYYKYVVNPPLFETIESKPELVKFGSPYKHYIGNFMTFEPEYLYDHVSFFGILGFPRSGDFPGEEGYYFDNDQEIEAAITKVDSFVKVGGTLQISANHDKPKFDLHYWLETFHTNTTLGKYEIITFGMSGANVIWWGRKMQD